MSWKRLIREVLEKYPKEERKQYKRVEFTPLTPEEVVEECKALLDAKEVK